MKALLTTVFGLFLAHSAFAMTPTLLPVDTTVIEVSGIVITGPENQPLPVPFVTLTVKNTGRGTYANLNGLFSVVLHKGETIVFSAIGYETTEYTVPARIGGNRKSITVVMKESKAEVPENAIFPWPSRENLRHDFLAMKPNQSLELEDLARANLSQRELMRIAKAMTPDGNEGADYYLRQQARSLYTYGQRPATPIFDPGAWAKFIRSVKKGDLKKKDDDDDE